jgi:hypothetical protein
MARTRCFYPASSSYGHTGSADVGSCRCLRRAASPSSAQLLPTILKRERTHLSLKKDAPIPRDAQSVARVRALAFGLGIAVAAVAFSQPSLAREPGLGLEDQPGGGTLGSSADNVPVGIFMVNQFFTDQYSTTIGPGAPTLATAGKAPNTKVFVNAEVFIFNPGRSFLGGRRSSSSLNPSSRLSPATILGRSVRRLAA